MWIILYLAPASLVAAVIFLVGGNEAAAQLAVIGWLVFTLMSWFAHGRTVPERIMAAGNACLFLLAIVAAVVNGRP